MDDESGDLRAACPDRDRRGRFAAGVSGNSLGRPREALSALCRVKRKLPEMLGEVARGVGEFREVDVGTRLRAAQLLLQYGFGPALLPAAEEEVSDVPRVQFVKRIVVDDPERFSKAL
jgi:hypothetical protein